MSDTYQLSLSKIGSGYDPEDFELVLERTAGTDCDEIAANWLSETYWVPQIQNGMIVAWNTEPIQESVRVPCTVCVKPKLQTVEPPCLETLCIVDADYCTCDGNTFAGNCEVDEGPLVFEPQTGPNGLKISGLEFATDRFTGSASEIASCQTMYGFVNNEIDGVVLPYVGSNEWEYESGEGSFSGYIDGIGSVTIYWQVTVRFQPCASSLLKGDPHRGVLTVATNRGTTSGSLGTGDQWQYYLHVPSDGQISLFDRHTLYRLGQSTEGGDCSFSGDVDTVISDEAIMEPAA